MKTNIDLTGAWVWGSGGLRGIGCVGGDDDGAAALPPRETVGAGAERLAPCVGAHGAMEYSFISISFDNNAESSFLGLNVINFKLQNLRKYCYSIFFVRCV